MLLNEGNKQKVRIQTKLKTISSSSCVLTNIHLRRMTHDARRAFY